VNGPRHRSGGPRTGAVGRSERTDLHTSRQVARVSATSSRGAGGGIRISYPALHHQKRSERHSCDMGQPGSGPGMKPAVHRLPGTVSHRVKQPTALQVHQAGHLPRGRLRGRGEKARPVQPERGNPCRRAGSSTSGLPWSRTARMMLAQPTPRSRAKAATGGRPYRPAGRPPPEPTRSAPPEGEPRPPARSRFPYRRLAATGTTGHSRTTPSWP
jgi:hypothetical protein